MYTSFFGLNDKPFSITPDPRYLFMSERHGEALAHLIYGVTESGGFIQLTGEVGTGKTTLVRTLLANRMPDNANVAVVLNPQLSALEFLQTICEELGVLEPEDPASSKSLIDALNYYLLAAHSEGRRTILVVDEAQNLSRDVLEQVRLLTNLETSKQKLLQIILIGQPELRELLARTDLRQLAQRITGRYHLEPLTRDETAQYIDHRMKVAGAVGDVFEPGAKREVFKLSQGVPRVINVICDRALLGAYSREIRGVSRQLVQRAAAEISGERFVLPWLRWATPAMIATGIALIAFGIWSAIADRDETVAVASVEQRNSQPIERPVAVVEAPRPAKIEAEPVEEPEASLDEQLELAGDLTDLETALRSLFSLWGLDYANTGQTGCDQARAAGYACLFERGTWNNLRQLDRPAILTLTDGRGTRHRAVLTAINGEHAELSIGGVTVSHPIASVSELWFGRYLLIWKPASGVALQLGPGTTDQQVVWLRESLAAIDSRYRAEPMDSAQFDTELENRVRQFQRDHRLVADGFAGHRTQIIINSLLAPADVPRLLTPRLALDE